MSKILILPITILSLIILGCANTKEESLNVDYEIISNPMYGEYQEYETPPFQFELIDSISLETPDNFLVASIDNIVTDPEGNIYFMDRRQWKLISFSADGTFRWMSGQEGKGPGDFENAYSMVTDGESIFIGNISGSRIDKFDFSGYFIKSIPMPKEMGFASLMKFTESGLLAVSSTVWASFARKVHFVDVLEDSVNLETQFVIDNSPEIEVPEGLSSGPNLKVHGNQVISGSLIDYSLTFFNPDSSIDKKIVRDFDKNTKPGLYSSGGSRAIRGFGGVNAPFIFPNGFMMAQVQWPDNVPDSDEYLKRSMNDQKVPDVIWKNSIDFFSPDGRLLYSIENDGYTPEIGSIKHVDEFGTIYTAKTTPDPVIYRYKLNVPEKMQ